ncbi:PSD1 and planctomycete cytochrome C domain-containing protein [Roseiconus nitratireducens]|nr:PSD1 and planctomycete cytochrome C domain-containing protein [Roseiconus nitratireducens]
MPAPPLVHARLILRTAVVAVCALVASLPAPSSADEPAFGADWQRNAFATSIFEINGTEARNNPLRRKLNQPFVDDELFIRYRIRYAAESVDTPAEDEGEFVVMWLDQVEGNEAATHSGGVPNIGIHVSGLQNRFMVRYASTKESFAAELRGGRDFLVVARLWKSDPGRDRPFDQLNLWIDPDPDAEFQPHASVESRQSVSQVKWIGFSTGRKTEVEDRIDVWDIELSKTWRGILELPEQPPVSEVPVPIAKRTIDFDQHVFPILDGKCFSCHSGDDAEIRLDVHDEVLNLVALRNADDSHLFHLVSEREMPPQDEPPLTEAEIKTLKTWIDEGLAWDADRLPPPRPQTEHWSFQPIVRPKIPRVKHAERVRNSVDAFIVRKQEALGIQPVPPADPETLARRMSLDLLGLPPTGSDTTVDELLSNPAYGERWGRHWLDVARWAESNGHQHNRFRPYSWRYRDWVVDAFNSDLPFDQFLAAQVAGDELAADDQSERSHLIATGFLAAARYSGNELDKRIQRNDILVDVVNTTTSAFLGLTFECAQCHTHKFDPISMRDYYRMQAFFANGQPGNLCIDDDTRAAGLVRERWEIYDRTLNRLVTVRQRKGVPNPELVLPKTVVSRISGEDKTRFQELENQIGQLAQTWGFYSAGKQSPTIAPHEMRWPLPRDAAALGEVKTHLLLRGDINAPGPEVDPGWPLVFGPTPELGDRPRKALANWLTGPDNPLTARVWVNRIWHWHFGKGLVETVSDFGKQGTPPSHPELLDFLASELIDHQWSTNHIHRLILDSATYRASSQFEAANAKRDPENASYWRWVPRRLESEAIRDSMLAVSGQLDVAVGGPSVPTDGGSQRRSLYLRQHRQRLSDQQRLFDGANGIVSCSRRRVSTTGLQPLWLLNSTFTQGAANALAEAAGTTSKAFQLCLGREPAPDELAALQTHAETQGLASACLVLLNTSEFLYIP